MPKSSTDFASSNPAFTKGDIVGSDAAHSATTPSTDHANEADHAQFDEAINYLPTQKDPNLNGPSGLTTLDHSAGRMTAWRENDDYREFFCRGQTPDSALVRYAPTRYDLDRDGDYDDNGGIPDSEAGDAVGSFESTGVNAIIIRRI